MNFFRSVSAASPKPIDPEVELLREVGTILNSAVHSAQRNLSGYANPWTFEDTRGAAAECIKRLREVSKSLNDKLDEAEKRLKAGT